jgi:hypothetical protein
VHVFDFHNTAAPSTLASAITASRRVMMGDTSPGAAIAEVLEMMRRRAMRRMVRRRRRRRLIIGGMLVVGTASAMHKMTQQDADKIQQTTGKSPEQMEPEELERAMAQAGVQPQPVTAEDQQAMAAAEAADPNPDEEVEAPE